MTDKFSDEEKLLQALEKQEQLDLERLANFIKTQILGEPSKGDRPEPELGLARFKDYIDSLRHSIKELCYERYEDFFESITEVGKVEDIVTDLRSLLDGIRKDIDALHVIRGKSDRLMDAEIAQKNIRQMNAKLKQCYQALGTCRQVYVSTVEGQYVKSLQWMVEQDSRLMKLSAYGFANVFEQGAPHLKEYVKQAVMRDFELWSKSIIDKKYDIGRKMLENEYASMDAVSKDVEKNVDCTRLQKCLYIFQKLDCRDEFKENYYLNRLGELSRRRQNLEVAGAEEVMEEVTTESCKRFSEKMLGFFVVEGTVMQKTNALLSQSELDSLWGVASNRIKKYLDDEMESIISLAPDESLSTVSQMEEFKQTILAFCERLSGYGYKTSVVRNHLERSSDEFLRAITTDSMRKFEAIIDEDIASEIQYVRIETEVEFRKYRNILTFELNLIPSGFDMVPLPEIVPGVNADGQQGVWLQNKVTNEREDFIVFPHTFNHSKLVPELCKLAMEFVNRFASFVDGLVDNKLQAVRGEAERIISGLLKSSKCRNMANLLKDKFVASGRDDEGLDALCRLLFNYDWLKTTLGVCLDDYIFGVCGGTREGASEGPEKLNALMSEVQTYIKRTLKSLLTIKIKRSIKDMIKNTDWMTEVKQEDGDPSPFFSELFDYIKNHIVPSIPLEHKRFVLESLVLEMEECLIGVFMQGGKWLDNENVSVTRVSMMALQNLSIDIKWLISKIKGICYEAAELMEKQGYDDDFKQKASLSCVCPVGRKKPSSDRVCVRCDNAPAAIEGTFLPFTELLRFVYQQLPRDIKDLDNPTGVNYNRLFNVLRGEDKAKDIRSMLARMDNCEVENWQFPLQNMALADVLLAYYNGSKGSFGFMYKSPHDLYVESLIKLVNPSLLEHAE